MREHPIVQLLVLGLMLVGAGFWVWQRKDERVEAYLQEVAKEQAFQEKREELTQIMSVTHKQFAEWMEQNPDLLVVVDNTGKLAPDPAQQNLNRAKKEYLELAFETYVRQLGLDVPWVRNYKFAKAVDKSYPGYELDFALPDLKIGVEINGGQGAEKSGHSNWQGLERDAAKQNLALILDWRIFWFTTSMLRKDSWTEHVTPFVKWLRYRLTYLPDWGRIDPKFNWVAVDGDGRVYAYRIKPILQSSNHQMWFCGKEEEGDDSCFRHIDGLELTRDQEWWKMLYQRPQPPAKPPIPEDQIPF